MEKFKNLSLVLAVMMALQVIMPVNFAYAAENVASRIDTSQTKTDIAIYVGDTEKPPEDDGSYKDVPVDAEIELYYDFYFLNDDGAEEPTDYNYYEEDYFKINFPSPIQFNIPTAGLELKQGSDIIGVLTIDGSEATVTFTDKVEGKSNIRAEFKIRGTFKSDVTGGEDPVIIDLGYGGKTIEIGFEKQEPEPVGLILEKEDPVLDLENGEIKWIVHVTPKDGKTASGVILKDTISDNQTYVQDTFVLSNTVTSSAVTASAITFSAIGFEYAFPEPIQGEQTLTYRTKINDMAFLAETNGGSSTKFNNNVQAFIGENPKGTVSKSITLDWINKKADLVDDGKKIKWTVTVNNYNGLLNGKNASIIDTIGANHEFVANADFPVKIKLDSGGETTVTTGSGIGQYSVSGKTLTYKFGNTYFEKAVLTYYTEINNPGATDNAINYYTNGAKLLWGDNSNGPSHGGSIGIGKGIIQKSASGPGVYGKNTIINWTVYINKNRVAITNALFTDTIPDGLIYKPETFRLNGKTVTPSAVFNEGSSKLTYTIPGTITIPQAITYSTLVDENFAGLFSNGDVPFTNGATLTGTGIKGTPGDEVSKIVESQVIAKSVAKKYDYTTRVVKWEIVVNRNQIPLKNVTVSDTIPLGMKFLPDTFKIDGNFPGTEKLQSVVKDEENISENDSFIYTIGSTSAKHVITYETKVKEKYLSATENLNKTLPFNNVTTISALGRSDVKVTAEETVDNYIVKKTGERTGFDFVKWSVPINANKVALSNVELTDTLQEGLALDISSVKLYELNVDADGKQSSGVEIDLALNQDKYSFDYNETTRKFIFEFKGDFNEAYLLEFVTDVTVDSITINNSIEFNGKYQSAGSTAEELYVNVNNWEGSGSASNGDLTIKKVDENGNLLTGAEFDVKDKAGKSYNDKKDPDIINGETVYKGLPFRWYYITETKAPEGYLLDKTVKKVKLSDTAGATIQIKNEKALADISLVKYDEKGEFLPGAEFTLLKGESSVGTAVTSEENGEVVFTNVELGKYTVKETGTPSGYGKFDEVIYVEVAYNSDKTGTEVRFTDAEGNAYKINEPLDVINSLVDISGNVGLFKADEAGNRLKGGVFAIYAVEETEPLKTAVSGDGENIGKVIFENIPEGDYRVEEIEAPAGYLKSSEVIYVNVGRDKADLTKAVVTYSYGEVENSGAAPTVENKSINIELLKTDKNGHPLAGAEFKLYDLDGNEVQSAVSNDFGEVVFTAVPEGTYTIKETKAPGGYKDYGKVITAAVTVVDNEAHVAFTVDGADFDRTVVNEKKPSGGGPTPVAEKGKIAVKKVDEDKKALSGAEFTLYDEDGNAVDTGVTGSDGIVSFTELEPGTYALKETEAPEGYVLSDEETEVEIEDGDVKTFTFTNEKEEPAEPGRIEIFKTDENGNPLSGAWFSLIDENGSTLQNIQAVDGKAVFEDVPAGRYTVKETQAPAGYELSSQVISVTAESEKTVTVSFVNKPSGGTTTVVPAAGNILINKVDENSTALPGAEFTLYNEDNQIIGTAVSDESGRVMFENLKEGKYFVKETKAPEGYEPVQDALTVDISESKTYGYRFRNVPSSVLIEDPDIPTGWEIIDDPDVPKDTVDTLPNTGSLLNTWLLAAIGFVLMLAGIALYRRKETRN